MLAGSTDIEEDNVDIMSAGFTQNDDLLEALHQDQPAPAGHRVSPGASIPPGLISILVLVIGAILAICLL
jgi:hypothetical protein